jgi:hypothetical protein
MMNNIEFGKPRNPDNLDLLIDGLRKRLGRWPTEGEVLEFIFGTKEEREAIWNGVDDNDNETARSHMQ